MKWFRRTPPPAIPPYQPPIRPVPPKDEPGIVVEEIDTDSMSRTGVYRAWDKLTGRLK